MVKEVNLGNPTPDPPRKPRGSEKAADPPALPASGDSSHLSAKAKKSRFEVITSRDLWGSKNRLFGDPLIVGFFLGFAVTGTYLLLAWPFIKPFLKEIKKSLMP